MACSYIQANTGMLLFTFSVNLEGQVIKGIYVQFQYNDMEAIGFALLFQIIKGITSPK